MSVLFLDHIEIWLGDDGLTADELFWLECYLNG